MGSGSSTQTPPDASAKLDAATLEKMVGPEIWEKHGKKFFEENQKDGTVVAESVMRYAMMNDLMPKNEGVKYEKPVELETKLFHDVYDKMPDQTGKTIAITGSTSGTGLCLAEKLAAKGARIIMLNRASSRAEAALAKVKAAAADASLVIHVDCDLQSFASVRAAAPKVEALGVAIDVLVNNAGIMASADVATGDGCDVQMQTNHLSHFLLTALLLPLIQKAAAASGQARIVQHSSGARSMVPKIDVKYMGKNGGNLGGDAPGANFQGPRWVRYAQTKLANLGFTLALADQFKEKGIANVMSLCAHPGLSSTGLQVRNAAEDPSMHGNYDSMMAMAQSVEDGTLGILRASVDPNPEIVQGSLLGPQKMTGPAIVMDAATEAARVPPEDRAALWQVSLETVGLVDFFNPSAEVAADAAAAPAAANDTGTQAETAADSGEKAEVEGTQAAAEPEKEADNSAL